MATMQHWPQLEKAWSSIARSLYLKTAAPVPLPAVGPLAELLHVTRSACAEVNALAAGGKLAAADIAAALDSNTVRLLGRLVQWLQAEPCEQLLLNSERQASLWQQLLLTLGNLLKVLQPEHGTTSDLALIARFHQQLQASGMLGQPSSSQAATAPAADTRGSSSSAEDAPGGAAVAGAQPGGVLHALQWLLQEHPHRCITASAGAWLLLQELLSPGCNDRAAAAGGGKTGGAAAGAEAGAEAAAGSSGSSSSSTVPVDLLMPQVGRLLQDFVDRAYASAAHPPSAPAQAAAAAAAATAASAGSAAPRRLASKERLDGGASGSGSPSGPRAGAGSGSPRGKGAAAAAAAASAAAAGEEGGGDGAPAGGEGGAAAEHAHPLALVDDPSIEVFGQLLARLHAVQVQLLILASTSAEQEEGGADAEQAAAGGGSWRGDGVPAKTHLQVLSVINCWLSRAGGPAAQAAAAAAGPAGAADLALAPLPAVAVEAVQGLGVSSAGSAAQLVFLAAREGVQADCYHYMAAQVAKAKAQARAKAAAAGDASSSGGDAAEPAAPGGFDPPLAFRLLLESVALLQACGVREALMGLCEPMCSTARCCSQDEIKELIGQQGGFLLLTLTENLERSQQAAGQAKTAAAGEAAAAAAKAAAGDEGSSSSSGSSEPAAAAAAAASSSSSSSSNGSGAAGDEAGAADREASAAAQAAGTAAMVSTHLMMEMCTARRAGNLAFASQSGIDERLLGLLTETDPARFYKIMDALVRNVRPEALTMLLPMSACFLAHDMAQALQAAQQAAAQQQGRARPARLSSGSSRSMVILHDPNVCRSFAAAVHGYSKGVLMPMVQAGGGCCGHDHDHEHGPDCGHDHAHDHAHGESCGHDHAHGESCGHDHAHGHGHRHHHHEHALANAMPPLQRVAEWLVHSVNATIAESEEAIEAAAAAAAARAQHGDAAAAGDAQGSGSGSDGTSAAPPPAAAEAAAAAAVALLASPAARAAQLQTASQAAASSLVLLVLMARAAVQLLQKLQDEVEALESAPGSASAAKQAGQGDALLVPEATLDVFLGLQFARTVFQVVCSRYQLSNVLEEQQQVLLDDAMAAAREAAAAGEGGKGGTAAGAPGADAAGAKAHAKELQAAHAACNAALQGRELAPGWRHLAFMLPPGAVRWAKAFQDAHPGDFVTNMGIVPVLMRANEVFKQQQEQQQEQQQQAGASGAAPQPVLPGPLRAKLLALLGDARRMFTGLMNEVPLPVGCNNPGCDSLEAVAEASLAINKRCSKCLAAHYCSRRCQVEHWPAHKAACKAIRG